MNFTVKLGLGFAAVVAVVVLIWNLTPGQVTTTKPTSTGGVSMVDGVQTITIDVKGGYKPNSIQAQAGVPTVVQFTTKGTFDCSSAVVIPQLGFEKMLKPTGTEQVALTADQATGTLKGQCAMGMYRFQVMFL